ncbi:hypothetical protein F886_00172 [Acinetobacter sp. NIPH 542]|uniref:hypothetical protein n=1 Tax=Acinetobacter sp. NIPH 542 TaxID=1217688 RepID=UPI0002CD9E77|nr:hypothetical protein [Acinetobacter sp. NIPH 542]ENX48371.1 hypothetical protein F886_00172 [Acinetobacter sp. NIPH 542]
MTIDRTELYWSSLCRLRSEFDCWVHIVRKQVSSTEKGRWGQLLTISIENYLEGPDGFVSFKDIDAVEISINCLMGGMANRPLEMIDIKAEILEALQKTQLCWEIRESTWVVDRFFEEEPVTVIAILNPFDYG